MKKSYITIYNIHMQKVAHLENAFDISYECPLNEIWTAAFSLPADDEKNQYCQPFYFAEVFDNDERLELYRILKPKFNRQSSGTVKTYQCEHVLATLLDDVLFLYHTVGNLGVYSRDVIQYILNRQNVIRWKLGTCEFDRQFEYNWENENLLGALFSVPQPFAEDYMWTYDTTSFPWTLKLVRPDDTMQTYIRYGINMQSITKEEDASQLVTLMLGLGYGEGVNQLTFSDLNGGLPYVKAEQEFIDRYGLITGVFVDKRIEYPETLLATTIANLNEAKTPAITYAVDASEIYQLTKDPVDRFQTGVRVRVIDEELGIDINARVVNKKKGNVLGAPGDVQLEIANKTKTVAGSIADLHNRQYISDVYSQGATNIDVKNFDENIDFSYPGIIKVWVPEQTTRINSMVLNWGLEKYRYFDAEGVHESDYSGEVLYVDVDGSSAAEYYDRTDGELDLIQFLDKDNDGKITRGAFHEIKFYSNIRARVTATVVTQLFIQSRGGGNY